MVDLCAGFASYSRGQRSHGQGRVRSHGGGSLERFINPKAESRKKASTTGRRRLGQGLRWKGKSRGRVGQRQACRGMRSGKKKPTAKECEITVERYTPREDSNVAETIGYQMETHVNAASSSGRADYEVDKYQVTVEENGYLVENNDIGHARGGFSGKSENMVEGVSFNLDDDEDGVGFRGKSNKLLEGIDFDIDDEEEEDILRV